MTIDLARARADKPGADHVTHLNNCGAALPPRQVLDRVIGHLRLEATIGGYEAADREAEALAGVYASAARMLNCGEDEIAIVENATRAWDMAFYSFRFKPGDRILTAEAEYASNYISFLQVARRTGAVIEAVPCDGAGQLDVAALRRMVDDRVKLVAVTHVPTNGGLVNPAAEIGRVARDAGIPYLLDACQSFGQMPLDVEAIGCDMLSATGRKFLRGPRGTGLLYVRRALIDRLEPPFLDLHAATWTSVDRFAINPTAKRFENWESNVAAKLGFGAAIDYATAWGLDAIYGRVRKLADELRAGITRIPGATLHDIGAERCGIVTFTLAGHAPEAVKAALAAQRINVSTSSSASTRLDMTRRRLDKLVRTGVHYYNSEEEIARTCATIAELA
ncbi:MAG: aminotransferase class V-fold PLP-dependent enzyme [Alphaproteobacteria bacterium]|nr:aminotransferase class V-fold PLP-dependent enzyme [Alphaproteobacteria bacterium]